ncbi:AAA family ATPase [Lacunisphaera limnophila]|nr:AAA family ATPase [Lacunisphaera limnophila]
MSEIELERLNTTYGTPEIKQLREDVCFLLTHGLPAVKAAPKQIKSHTWSFRSDYELRMASYLFEKILQAKAADWDELQIKERSDYEYEHGIKTPIIKTGVVVAIIDDRIIRFEVLDGMGSTSITVSSGNHDISDLVELLTKALRHNNPLRGKLVQILMRGNSLDINICARPKSTFKDFVTNTTRRDELWENTVLQLQLGQNNGIICHGDPGTGKSLVCAAAANEAIAAGYSAAYLVGCVPFDEVDRVIRMYLAPAIIGLEDIDAFGEDRINGRPSYFADFLQFMNGITEREDPIVVIATTNHLELLDAAIKNRPVRFNRKYEFNKPTNPEISVMVDRWFGAKTIDHRLHKLCYDRGLTGAHIREIHRTAMTIAAKDKKELADVFATAVEVVSKHFITEWKPLGFASSTGKAGG